MQKKNLSSCTFYIANEKSPKIKILIMERKIIILTATLTLSLIGNGLASSIAKADSPQRRQARESQEQGSKLKRLQEADKNSDGFLIKEEITGRSRLAANFERIDTNKYRKLDVDEIKQFIRSRSVEPR
jgi:hypothetical protein